ncbi:MAG: hypothetical protein E7474_13270 [Ruminococcaceae bacterium]|nr:hypothetical protein [Oscillospiraceae bacterium]
MARTKVTGYSSKTPDMSRRTDLAGKTVSSNGMNVTYDADGYAVSATKYSHASNAETDRSVRAPSIDVYDGKVDRTAYQKQYGLSDSDVQHMSDRQLEGLADTRGLINSGAVSAAEGHDVFEGVRAQYGYSGGGDGSAYSKKSYTIFDPADATTQPLSGSFRAQPTTGWTTQQSERDDAYYAGGAAPFAEAGDAAPIRTASGAAARTGAARGAGYGYAIQDGGLTEQYLGLYGADGAYAQLRAQQQAANDAAVERAVSRLEEQKRETNDAYNEYYRQAYVDWMNAQRDVSQRMAAQGVTGGAAESTLLGLSTAYSDALRQAEQKRLGALGEIDRAIADTRYDGDVRGAQTAAQSAQEQINGYADALRYLMDRYDTLGARQEAYDREDAQLAARYAREDAQLAEKYAREDAQREAQAALSSQSWARSLVQSMLAQGNMPDDDTLAAAGLTRAQAAALLPAVPESAYTPTFTQSQVYDAAKRGLLTGNMLRDYNWYVYGDPDYGASAPAASVGVRSGGSGARSSGNSGSSARQAAEADAAGMNESMFNQEARAIMHYLSQGMAQKARDRLTLIWDDLSAAQRSKLAEVFSEKGYMQ